MKEEPTRQEIIEYANKLRERGKALSIQQLVYQCIAYDKESRRADKLHTARMKKRTEELYAAIKHAYHDLHRKPLDEVEMAMYRRWLIEKRERLAKKLL